MVDSVPGLVTIEVLSQGQGRDGADNPYRVRMEAPYGTGTASGTLDLQALLSQLQPLEQDWHAQPLEYGQALYRALFAGDPDGAYRAALNIAGSDGLRVRLSLDETAPRLHTVKWERLYQPAGNDWVPLAANPNVILSRYLNVGRGPVVPLGQGRLRALVVIANPRRDFDSQEEHRAIAAIFGQFGQQIEPVFLEDHVTLDAMVARLAEGFHILHFIGHGVWNPPSAPGTFNLLLERWTDGQLHIHGVTDVELIARLRNVLLPNLIFLAACSSAQQSTNDTFVGMGPRLVQAGCPAVICMQEPVLQDVARKFSGEFYATLLREGIVDLAVNRARPAVFGTQTWQWAVPVLFMNLFNGVLFSPQRVFLARQPYKFLYPFTAADSDIFRGRDEETAAICARVARQRVTVVHGAAGMGLTSLLEAGVRPRLLAAGNLVVRVADYADLSGEFRRGLAEDAGRRLPLPPDTPLADLLLAAGSAWLDHPVVLFLDQFERLLDLPSEARSAAVQALAQSLDGLGERLRLVLALHSDHLPALARLQPVFEDLRLTDEEVLGLDEGAATAAITGPLDVVEPHVTLSGELAGQIAVDLMKLRGRQDGAQADGQRVDPGQLQIVCDHLYQLAIKRAEKLGVRREIDRALYERELGAQGILASYIKRELEEHFADVRDLARQALVAMASDERDHWMLPEELRLPGATPEAADAVLDRLVDRKFLASRLGDDGRNRYAFANETVAREARQFGGRDFELKHRANEELERIWRMWLAEAVPSVTELAAAPGVKEEAGAGEKPPPPASERSDRALATGPQLRYLADAGPSLKLTPVKALLLLRSAVRAGRPPDRWVEAICPENGGLNLVAQLEAPAPGEAGVADSDKMDLDYVRRLLGLYDVAEPTPADLAGKKFGDVAWATASTDMPVTRQTCALALRGAYPEDSGAAAVDRLDAAVDAWSRQSGRSHWRGDWRRAEIWGTLIEASYPPGPEATARLGRTGRGAIWLWRVRRRIIHDGPRLLGLIAGGAVGAGLLLGVLRALLALLTDFTPGLQFNMGLWWGIILVGALMSGILLGYVFWESRRVPAAGRAPAGWRRFGLAVLLGTVLFGTAHLIIASSIQFGAIGEPVFVLAGYIAGLGLSLALAARPWDQGKHRLGSWLGWLGVAGLFTGLAEGLFLVTGGEANIVVSAWGSNYKTVLESVVSAAAPGLVSHTPRWYNALGLLDAVLVGIALCAGALLGTSLAARFLNYWNQLEDRAGM